MKSNMGETDRIIRAVLGIGLLASFAMLPAPQRYVGLLGVIPLLTAVVGFCPLYRIFGFRTTRDRSRRRLP